jgi:aryl-alcohol dehydrogenase-like predicted oxidoreductase
MICLKQEEKKEACMKSITRRTFFSGMTAGIAGMLFGSHPKIPSEKLINNQDELKIKQYNPLGKTGIKTSDIIFGAGAIHNPGVIRYAFDLGINIFDTASNYGRGVSEEIIGQGLKGVRDRAHIITKQYFQPRRRITKESITRLLEASFKNLQTDYVDGLFIHTMKTMHLMRNEEIVSSFSQFKKEGKVRFTGFSTHNEKTILAECVKPEYSGLVDAVMFMYNHIEGKMIEPLIAKMRQKGIGTIAMKTLAGGKQGNLKKFVSEQSSYPQAAISWVLANEHIDCAALTMDNYSLIEDYVAASGKKLDRTDLALLQKYRDAVSTSYCRVSCTSCESDCPHNVAISDIMRYVMYYEDYGHQKRAIDQYSELDDAHKPLLCQSCRGYCSQACPYGLRVKEQLLRAYTLLTV